MVRPAIVFLLWEQKMIKMEAEGIWVRYNKIKYFGARDCLILESDLED